MYPYVVHIERENLREMAIRTSDRNVYSFYNPRDVRVDATMDADEYSGYETFYCRDQQSAEALAATFAAKKPGRAVYILKLVSVTQAPPTAPVISNYTEKGLIPR